MTPIDYNNPNDPWLHTYYDPYKGLSDEERIKTVCMQVAAFIVMLIAGLVLCALFGSCTTTKYVTMPEYHTDTVRVTQYQRDSIYMHDSIHVTEKGDTVRIEKWHTKYIEKAVHDTTYIAKTDSVPVPYPVVKEVEKELTWWQKLRIHVGDVMLIALLGGVVYIVGRWILRIWW